MTAPRVQARPAPARRPPTTRATPGSTSRRGRARPSRRPRAPARWSRSSPEPKAARALTGAQPIPVAARITLDLLMLTASHLPTCTGVGFKPEHFGDILAGPQPVGFFEIHAENYMGAGGPPHAQLTALRER